MGQLDTLRTRIIEANKALRALIENVKEEVLNLPDNPKAERIAPNIVIVNSKDLLAENWTAEFYNFKWQYQAVALYISAENATPEQLLKRIETILAEAKVPYPQQTATMKNLNHISMNSPVTFDNRYKQALHPDVVTNLKNIFTKVN